MTSLTSKAHSPYAPSASHRWTRCPGSINLEAQHPGSASSIYAQEGSAAHLLGEMRLKRVLTAQALTQTKGKRIKDIAPQLDPKKHDYLDVVVNDEMIWCVQEYVLYVESLLPKGASVLENCAVETRVTTDIHQSIAGTVDATVVDWPMTLHVIDLKYGAGNQVEAEDNSQLAIYGLGAIEKFSSDYETIKLHIFQPRGDGDTFRVWEMPLKEFREKWRDKVAKAYERTKTEPTTYTPGTHCRWCKGAVDCPQSKSALKEITKKGAALPSNVADLSRILNLETAVLEYLNQCKARAFEILSRGINVPGFKLVKTFGREKWIDEDGLTENMIQHGVYGNKRRLLTTTKFKTPKQIRKILGEDYPEELDKFTTTPFNGAKLVPESDKRPRYLPAAEVFDG